MGSARSRRRDLFQGFLTTALADDEIVTEVRLPAMDGYGFAYEKFTRRAEDWAMVGVCALVKVERRPDRGCARGAHEHGGQCPLRAAAVESGAARAGATDAIAAAAEPPPRAPTRPAT